MNRQFVRFAIIVLAGLSVGACVVVVIPDSEANTNWVEERLAEDGINRTAPNSIPETTLDSTLTRDMDRQVSYMLERRDLLEAEQADIESIAEVSTEDFVETGKTLTTPPS